MDKLILDCDDVKVDPLSYTNIRVTMSYVDDQDLKSSMKDIIEAVEVDNVLEHIDMDDAIAYYSNKDILDEIGKENCMTHFEIEEKEAE